MAQRVELGYKVTVEGAPELQGLAQSQRAVKQSAEETNQVLGEQDKAFDRGSRSADAYARKMESLRRAAFKRGETYDPELAEEARVKSLANAHKELDAQIQRGQLAQLRGYDRLKAERDIQLRDLNALGDSRVLAKVDQAFVQRVNALRDATALARVKAAESAVAPEFSIGARQAGQIIRNPGAGIGGIADGAAESLGAAGTAAIGIAAALAAAAAAGISLVHSSAEWAQNTANTASRLGISSTQMVTLAAGAKIAGVNIQSLEASTRVLSQALEDPTGSGKKVVAELQKIGVAVYDSTGKTREFGPVLIDLLGKLSGVSSQTERLAVASRVLGRPAKELEPWIKDLDRLTELTKQLGIATEGPLVDSLSKSAQEFNKLGLAYDRLKLILAGKIAPIVVPIVTQLTEAASSTTANGALRLLGAFVAGGPVAAYQALKINNAIAAADAEAQKGAIRVGEGHEDTNSPEAKHRQEQADLYKKRFGQTEQGLEERKSELTKKIAEDNGKLSSPDLNDASRATIGADQTKSQAELRQVEERLKQLHKDQNEYQTLKQQVEGFQKAADQFDLTGLEKIQAKYKELVADIKKAAADKTITKGQAAQLAGGAEAAEKQEIAQDRAKQAAARIREQIGLTEQLLALQTKPGDDLHAIQAKFQAANANVAAQFATGGLSSDDRDKELAKTKNDRDKSLIEFYGRQIQEARQQSAALAGVGITSRESQFEKQRNFNPFGVFNQSDEEQRARDISQSRQGEIRQQQTVQAGLVGPGRARQEADLKATQEDARLQEQLLDIRLRGEQQILQIRKEQITTSTSERLRLAQVTGNPEDQVANIQAQHDIKLEGLQEELALTGDIVAFKKASDAEEFDRVQQLLELRRQEAEKFKSTITEGILALQNGGREGLSKFAQNFGKQVEAKILGNAAGVGFNILQPLFPQIGGQHEVGPDGKPVTKNGVPQLTFLGQLLKGTPFGEKSDPQKLATDTNTEATKLNTAAIDKWTGQQNAIAGPKSPVSAGLQAIAAAKDSCGCGGVTSGGGVGGFGHLFQGGGTSVDSSVFYDSDGLPLPGTGPLNPDLFPSVTSDEGGGEDTGSGGASSDTGGLPLPGVGPLNPSTLPSASAIPSALQSTFKAAGAAGAIAGGIFGVVSGLEKGGVRGDVSAAGSALGAGAGIALLAGPAGAPVAAALGLASLVTKLIGSFLPDARADRAKQEERELQADRYVKPNSINVTETTAGNAAFTNANGGLNVLKGAPLVQLYNQILGIDPLNPKHLLSATNQQLSTSTQALPSDLNPNISHGSPSGTTNIYLSASVPVSTIDSKSFLDNSGNIADAMSKALRDGHRIGSDIVKRVRPQ
jgi:hypothetical protein